VTPPHPAVRWLLLALVVAFPIVFVLGVQGQNALDDFERTGDPDAVGRSYDAAERFDLATNTVSLVAVAAAVGVGAWIRRNRVPVPKVPLVMGALALLFVRGEYFPGFAWTFVLAVAAVLTLRHIGKVTRSS